MASAELTIAQTSRWRSRALSCERMREDSSPEQLVARIEALRARVAPQFPDMDPGDLLLILESLCRPFGSGRRIFLREREPGVYVF